MKHGVFLLTLLAASLVSLGASADGATVDADGVYHLKPITIVGRPNKPSVVIELTRPTAASAARVAHEDFHVALLVSTQPATLGPKRPLDPAR